MEISTNLELSYYGYILARITKCRVYGPGKTFSGLEFTFSLTIEPTGRLTGSNPKLDRMEIELYLTTNSAELYLGSLKRRSLEPLSISYPRDHQYRLRIGTHSFLKLIDETHAGDLNLKIEAQAVLLTDEPLKNSSGGPLTNENLILISGESRFRFPHSDWIEIINGAHIDYFDVITLRSFLSELPEHNVFRQAFDKLRQARESFNRGDWNAVGSACRNALSTVLSLAPSSQPKIKHVLSSVDADPYRQSFGGEAEGAIDKIRSLLNHATHQGGNAAADTPPANLRREDALFTLHLTAAAISYMASVYNAPVLEN